MIEFVAKNIIRIFRDGKEETPALIKERIEEVSFQKKETEDFIEYDNGFLKVKVNKQGLVLIEKDGEIIFEEVSFDKSCLCTTKPFLFPSMSGSTLRKSIIIALTLSSSSLINLARSASRPGKRNL